MFGLETTAGAPQRETAAGAYSVCVLLSYSCDRPCHPGSLRLLLQGEPGANTEALTLGDPALPREPQATQSFEHQLSLETLNHRSRGGRSGPPG